MSNKVYEQLGLTKEDVIDIQSWLFPTINDKERVSEMIVAVVNKFSGAHLHYALYILGNEMGQAKIKDQLGLEHILNPAHV